MHIYPIIRLKQIANDCHPSNFPQNKILNLHLKSQHNLISCKLDLLLDCLSWYHSRAVIKRQIKNYHNNSRLYWVLCTIYIHQISHGRVYYQQKSQWWMCCRMQINLIYTSTNTYSRTPIERKQSLLAAKAQNEHFKSSEAAGLKGYGDIIKCYPQGQWAINATITVRRI